MGQLAVEAAHSFGAQTVGFPCRVQCEWKKERKKDSQGCTSVVLQLVISLGCGKEAPA